MGIRLGIALAGGRGSRLALGIPKALARVSGETLLARCLATLESLCDEVVVAAPHDLALPVAADRLALDVADASGPLAGLVSGLRSRPYASALVLGVDFPLVRPALLETLAARLSGWDAVVPAPAGIPQPLVAAYAPGAAAGFSARFAAGERSVTAALGALRTCFLDDRALAVLPGGVAGFLNVNTPEDLAEAERRIAEAPVEDSR